MPKAQPRKARLRKNNSRTNAVQPIAELAKAVDELARIVEQLRAAVAEIRRIAWHYPEPTSTEPVVFTGESGFTLEVPNLGRPAITAWKSGPQADRVHHALDGIYGHGDSVPPRVSREIIHKKIEKWLKDHEPAPHSPPPSPTTMNRAIGNRRRR